MPGFKKLVKNKLPKPFNKIGRLGSQATDLISVSDEHQAIFMWHDGPERTDRSFYAYLLCILQNGDLSPLFELHYHPSHKGLHCKMPCRTTIDFRNRLLSRAPELSLKTCREFDPALEHDRAELIKIFCETVGIVTSIRINHQGDLWS
jgi:hypothetical protein